jgi:glycosyltransferase involved in cell wall biosynthesis
MQTTPLVSVVIPAYDHERFVGEAIASVQAQTLRDLELIVIDDGSHDATASIAESIAAQDARIRVLRQPNGGSHAAINRGMSMARAPWIAILNSDDRHHPGRLERMVQAAGDRHDFAVSDARLIDADGQPVTDASHWWLKANREVREYARAHGPIDGLLYGNYTVSTSNFLIRRSLAQAIGPVRPRRHVLDWDYALRAALHAPERFLYLQDEALFDYRIHGGNAILARMARGAAEMGHMHRGLLPRLGVPAGLASALFRAQRDLRRHARANGAALRAAEVQALADVNRTLAAEIDRLRAACADAERIAHEREADRRTLEAELAAMRASPAWRLLRRLRLTGTRH